MSQKPQILLIGDSIRMGYCHNVRAELESEAEVLFPEGNCRCTAFVMESIAAWLTMCDPERLSAIHFNCGHWDAARFLDDDLPVTPLNVYAENVGRILSYLKRRFPDAAVSFATTTPMNPDPAKANVGRTTDELREYNRVGAEAAKQAGADIDDLFALTEDWPAEAFLDYCHFTDESNKKLGAAVSEFLRGQLKK